MKFGKFAALRAETLVIGNVPVENVHLHGFHTIQVALEDFDGNEMAARVNQQAAPGETRLILDVN